MIDAKKFGTFIAAMRKENNMTQLDLAGKLHVTDKAVSRWERGLGFPDISTLEPLADALGVSVLEIMRSERIEAGISPDTASGALADALELVKLQRRAERASMGKLVGGTAAVLLAVFLIDSMGWAGFAMAAFPVICLLAGAVLTAYGAWRRKNRLPCLQTWLLAAALLLIPVCMAALLFFAGALGAGPVPN